MALNYLGIVSYGSYPTPTPTDAVRSRLAVSMGLLTFEFLTITATIAGRKGWLINWFLKRRR